jgi:DNA repair protein RecO
MYPKYTTEGFLVAAKESKEADKYFLFYTRNFGMILASATGVRLSKSKLRPNLQSGAKLYLTLLKSKQHWKLTEVEAIESISPRGEGYKSFLRILSTVKSLVHGEEANQDLFESLIAFHKFIFGNKNGDQIPLSECLAMIKVLNSLGYGDHEEAGWGFDEESLQKINKNKSRIIIEINKALKATGL